MKSFKKQAGFTLVEIAIVLVIVGLLLAGVLKGQELIESSRIKAIATDMRGIQAATICVTRPGAQASIPHLHETAAQ